MKHSARYRLLNKRYSAILLISAFLLVLTGSPLSGKLPTFIRQFEYPPPIENGCIPVGMRFVDFYYVAQQEGQTPWADLLLLEFLWVDNTTRGHAMAAFHYQGTVWLFDYVSAIPVTEKSFVDTKITLQKAKKDPRKLARFWLRNMRPDASTIKMAILLKEQSYGK